MSLPICPTDCSSSAPIVADDANCGGEYNFGELNNLYFSAEPFPNWKTIIDDFLIANPASTYEDAYAQYVSAFCARVSNTSTDQDAIRCICIRGEKGEPESNPIRVCGGGKVYPPKTHSITYSIDDTGSINYEALRQLECNGKLYVQYSDSKYLYGGDCEGEALNTTINWSHIIPLSFEELQTFTGTIEWDAQFHPARIEKPTC